jgi:hypothetical protein
MGVLVPFEDDFLRDLPLAAVGAVDADQGIGGMRRNGDLPGGGAADQARKK